MLRHSRFALIGALAVSLSAASAGATMIQFDMTIEFSGATPPQGASPWMTVTIDDGGSAGSVDIMLEATNLTGGEFVFGWYLNLDPALDPDDLIFSAPTKVGAFADPTISTGINAFMADGDGKFDILVGFSSGGGPSGRFGAGESVKYTVTGIGSLTANSFDFLSQESGGHGPFPTAAHVGGIGENGDDSGWISTPEPASMLLLAFGGVASMTRRRR